MSWLVQSINPTTKKVTLIDAKGKKLEIDLPEHQTIEERVAYLNGHTERKSAHKTIDNVKNVLIAVLLIIIAMLLYKVKLLGI